MRRVSCCAVSAWTRCNRSASVSRCCVRSCSKSRYSSWSSEAKWQGWPCHAADPQPVDQQDVIERAVQGFEECAQVTTAHRFREGRGHRIQAFVHPLVVACLQAQSLGAHTCLSPFCLDAGLKCKIESREDRPGHTQHTGVDICHVPVRKHSPPHPDRRRQHCAWPHFLDHPEDRNFIRASCACQWDARIERALATLARLL